MADPTIDNILEKRAAFGANFLGTTNLAQRRRYEEDIQAARDAEKTSLAQQFDRANRVAELSDPLKARSIRNDEERLRQSAGQFTEREDRLRDALSLRERAAQWKMEQKGLEVEDANTILDHTRGLRLGEFEMRRRGIKPGTEAYANGVFDLAAKYDHADPKLMTDISKAARIDEDIGSILVKRNALEEKGVKTRFRYTEGPNGPSFTLTEEAPQTPKTVDPTLQANREGALYDKMVKRFNEEGDPEFKSFLEKQIHTMRSQMQEKPSMKLSDADKAESIARAKAANERNPAAAPKIRERLQSAGISEEELKAAGL